MTVDNVAPIANPPEAQSLPPQGFPTAAVTLTLLLTGGALLVAAVGWQWGSAPSPAGWWTRVWLYLNLAMGFLWFVVWPALALRPSADKRINGLAIMWLGMAVGSLPAFWMAYYFGAPSTGPFWQCLLMQVCWAVFAFGVVAVATRWGGGGTVAARILSFLYLMGPLLWYLAAEFTQVWRGWASFAPAMDIFAAVGGRVEWALWWASGYGLIGLILTALASFGRRQISRGRQ